ncbi:MAG: hypothetical protein Q8R60_10410 [Mycobacteriales bacterium]|nr:hypothetical protein [Mycobacteriales bacterium]
MGIDELADALYALPPEAFTVARGTAARADPSSKQAITALRRPTVAAWIVNVLVRHDPAVLEDLLALGPALVEAQRAGDGPQLRTLSERRRALLGTVTARAVELAYREVTGAVRSEVEATLDAALADPASADAVRSGRLVRALSYAGFGGVDLDGATAVPMSAGKAAAGKATGGKATGDRAPAVAGPSAAELTARAELERLEADALDAAGRLDDAVRALDTSCEAANRAAADLTVADAEVARAEEALAQARQRRTAVHDRERETTSARAAAERAVTRAQARAEKARLALDARRRG